MNFFKNSCCCMIPSCTLFLMKWITSLILIPYEKKVVHTKLTARKKKMKSGLIWGKRNSDVFACEMALK